jgi:hypothetical protein
MFRCFFGRAAATDANVEKLCIPKLDAKRSYGSFYN